MHLVGFTIEIYYDARSYKRQTYITGKSNPKHFFPNLWFFVGVSAADDDHFTRYANSSHILHEVHVLADFSARWNFSFSFWWLVEKVVLNWMAILSAYTVCPTRYRTRHFFNNFTTNEDIATKFKVYPVWTHTYTNTLEQQTYCVGTLSQMTERSAERRVRQETGWLARWLADRCSASQQLGALQTHPLHFSHNERTPVQISLQYLHRC